MNVPPQCFVPITDRNHQELLDELEWKYRRKREQDGGFEPERDAQKVKLGALFPLFFSKKKPIYFNRSSRLGTGRSLGIAREAAAAMATANEPQTDSHLICAFLPPPFPSLSRSH